MFIVRDRSIAVVATLLFASAFAAWGHFAAQARVSAPTPALAAIAAPKPPSGEADARLARREPTARH